MHPLTLIGGATLTIGSVSAGWIAYDTFVMGHRREIGLMQHHHPVHPESPVYWLSMQVGMVLGYITSLSVNRWLIHRGTGKPCEQDIHV